MTEKFNIKSDDELLVEIKDEISKYKRYSEPNYRFSKKIIDMTSTTRYRYLHLENDNRYEKYITEPGKIINIPYLGKDDYLRIEYFRKNKDLFYEYKTSLMSAYENSDKYKRKMGKLGLILFASSIGLFILTIIVAIGIYADTKNSALSFALIKIISPVSILGFIIGLVVGIRHDGFV